LLHPTTVRGYATTAFNIDRYTTVEAFLEEYRYLEEQGII
jgi:hypothetical protein